METTTGMILALNDFKNKYVNSHRHVSNAKALIYVTSFSSISYCNNSEYWPFN